MKSNTNYWILATLILMGTLWSSNRCISESSGEQDGTWVADGKAYYTAPQVSGEYAFSNEVVPTQRFEIYERLDRELLSNSYFHSNTFLMIKRANRYFPVIEPILVEEGVPTDFKYLAVIESSLDIRSYSPAGAAGIWQFMKGTATDMGLEVNSEVDERYNITKATHAACKYFKQLYTTYNNWTLVAAAYNAGPNKINESIAKQKENDYYNLLLNAETKRYVLRIVAMKSIIENPIKYGFKLSETDLYPALEGNTIEIDSAITNIPDFAIAHSTTYAEIKEYNPWLRDYSLTNKAKKTYTLMMPKKNATSTVVYNTNWVKQQENKSIE